MTADGPAGRRGKWSKPGVPHEGWTCVEIEDLGRGEEMICEMCETTPIRFVHHMENERYHEPLQCGCICSGNMEGDVDAALLRDKAMKSRAGKRRRWPRLDAWRLSRQGNPWIRKDDFLVTVFHADGQYMASVKDGDVARPYYVRRRYVTETAAKLGAFDKITEILQRRGELF